MSETKAVTKLEPQSLITAFSRDQVDLIKRQYARDATDDELKLFLYAAQSQGLDPLRKQIYFMKNKKGQVVHITSIDGYRLVAARTGEHVGTDDAIFDNDENPSKATVTVYRLVNGVRCTFTASARWSEYYPGKELGFMWDRMPCTMLGKCAEALALRKAFPNELGALYIKEEMDQAAPIEPEIYTGTLDQEKRLAVLLEKKKLDESLWEAVSRHLKGQPTNLAAVETAIALAISEV